MAWLIMQAIYDGSMHYCKDCLSYMVYPMKYVTSGRLAHLGKVIMLFYCEVIL